MRRALLLLLTLVSGCLSPAEVLTTTSTTPAITSGAVFVHVPGGVATASDAMEPLLFEIGHKAAEPTMGVNAEGTLFITALTFENDVGGTAAPLPRADILRSKDQGATWEDVTPMLPGGVRQQTFSTDPFLHLDTTTGRVFTIDQQRLTCYVTSYSDDEGETWAPPASACTHPVVDHQSLVTFKPRVLTTAGYPNGVLVCYNKVATTICVRSLDGGRTYHDAGVVGAMGVTPGGDVCSGLAGHLAAAPDGTLYLPRAECGVPLLFKSLDDGTTWERIVVSENRTYGDGSVSPEDPAVAVDADGNLYYVWQDSEGLARLATSTDGGATWSTEILVGRPDLTAMTLVTVGAGDAGKIAIAYYGSDVPGGYAANETAMKNATWHGYLAVLTDALSPAPSIVTARVSPLDDPLVTGQCGPGRCPGIIDFMDVVIDAEGRPFAAFVDWCLDHCEEPTDSGLVATLAFGPKLRGEGTLSPHPAS